LALQGGKAISLAFVCEGQHLLRVLR